MFEHTWTTNYWEERCDLVRPLGRFLGPLWGSWEALGLSEGLLGGSWEHLAVIWEPLGRVWGPLGLVSWGHVGTR